MLTYLPHPDIRDDLLQFLIEEKISYDMALQRLISLPESPMDRLTLAYLEPAHGHRYREHIRCPIRFDAPDNTLLLRDDALDLPLRGGDAETHEHCLRLLNDVFDRIRTGATLSHQLRRLFCADLSRTVSLSEAAQSLCCTGRTLNRRLAKENTNYSDLYSSTRLEAAQNLLATTHLGSSQIAERLGFADARSLRRFFHAHTGRTLQQFRANSA
jgi:AraC-like DNA-binding protein